MTGHSRRHVLGMGAASAGTLILPRFAIAQADNRPSITIAVQKVTNSNVLDVLREQSNVGERIFFSSIWEGLISRNWRGNLEAVPGLATEWKRIDDQTVELKLRQGVKFHNGDEMTAEDVLFSFGRERMFGATEAKNRSTIKAFEQIPTPRAGKELPPEVPAVARRIWPDLVRIDAVDKYTVRFINATPDVTLEGRLSRYGSNIASRRAWEEAASYLDWARKPVTTGPYKVVEMRPDVSLTLEAHDEYWGGRPPLKRIRFVEVPEVASRINGLLSGEYQFACDIPPDQIASIEKNAAFEVQGGTISNHRLTVFDKNHAQLAESAGAARLHPRDRPAGDRRQPVGRTHPRAARPAVGVLCRHVPGRLERAGVQSEACAGSAQAGQLQGRSDPVSDAEQLLHQPGRDRAGPGRDVEERRPQRPDRDQGELDADHGAQRRARRARLVQLRALSTIRSRRWWRSTARRASSSRSASGPTPS